MKKYIKYIIILIIGLLIGLFIGKTTIQPKPIIKINTITDTTKISELTDSINSNKKEILELKEKVKEEKYKIIILKDSIKDLGITESVQLLRENLNDTFPKLHEINEDTLILINDNNLKEINCTFADLSSTKKLNNYYESIISKDSTIIDYKDSIILSSNNIIEKQNILAENLTTALMAEERKKNLFIKTTIGSTIVAVIFGGLVLWQLK